MKLFFIIYILLIPVVPLIGAGIFKRRQDKPRRNICYGLFALQILLSAVYMSAYL